MHLDGPVADIYDTNTVNKLIKEVEIVKKKYKAFLLKMDPAIPSNKELKDKYLKLGYKIKDTCKDIYEFMQPIKSMVLNIEGLTESEILAKYSQKTRYNIKIAQKNNVIVRYSKTEEDLKIFYNLMRTTAKRNNIPLRAYSYFKSILNSYNENELRIYIAEYNGIPLSSAMTINYAGTTTYLYGASSNENRNVMPNYLMQQNMIKWAIETKCSKYDFGGIFNVDTENGLYRFKIGFCKEEGVTEFIGEIDKIYNKFLYFTFKNILPLAKHINSYIAEKFKKKGENGYEEKTNLDINYSNINNSNLINSKE